MKQTNLIGTLVLSAVFISVAANSNETPSSDLNPYLGEQPPGLTPKPFAPGKVTTKHYELTGLFSHDMSSFYLIRNGGSYTAPTLTRFKNEKGQWHEEIVSKRVGTPFISPDGQTMYLSSRYKTKTGDKWSEIKKLPAPFGTLPTMRLTVSAKGTYFFDEFKKDFTGDIRYARLIKGEYETPKLLSKNINAGKSFHPFIAPDESYLIFDTTRAGGFGGSDLYISFKSSDGSWGDPINMGDKINTPAWEALANVTPDGKYLFFNRNMNIGNYDNVDIFWVDAQIINNLKSQQ
ncbi:MULTISPECIES: PD40 domain-containing protein [Pseudoalteromonas]|uniref:Periplasmic component of the Tol biopolymer transport system n=1 Tax=Pseudoalteromonas luteoviolacea (strain 2ta16) TaxID=1353533 RepID=V4HL43_PSEL2|nr:MULTISPECIES: PD40 domain-containing protein [Pseudoalteromonas]ESP90473.1 hypothetical protein PL2TA16_01576 [Pseudoalteromonas luteoviolacea 2ta16]KZN41959.1 hypothetical protein N483_14910 [Pseudoalteromonas luteoviolacea NCIMB 1944]MCG7549820.1 PD40 domain-containing protein [Pseudoalteromonas sp. Of7M-16]